MVQQPILIGVDFSAGAAQALTEGVRLAQRLGTAIRVVHVVERYGEREGLLAIEAGDWMERCGLSRDALEYGTGVPWVELTRAAAESGASMIVVGSHGRTGFQPLALGSTAARLAVRAGCPVLVVASSAGGV